MEGSLEMCNHNNFITHKFPDGKVMAMCGTCNANWYINVNEEQAKMAVWNTKPAKPEIIKSIKLFCNDGNHDKVYNVYLQKDSYYFVVWAEYGKRNSNLKRIDKGNFFTRWQAESEFQKLETEKKAKGYQEVIEAPPKQVKSLKSSKNQQVATVTLDLSSPEGRQLYLSLLGQSDVLVTKENPVPDPKNLSLTPVAKGRKFRDE